MKEIQNNSVRNHEFLKEMYADSYFPKFLVDKCRKILIELCVKIETQTPHSNTDLYKLTQTSTEEINALSEEFSNNGSEIETAARECIASDFEFIAKAYGFEQADVEEMIATRDW